MAIYNSTTHGPITVSESARKMLHRLLRAERNAFSNELAAVRKAYDTVLADLTAVAQERNKLSAELIEALKKLDGMSGWQTPVNGAETYIVCGGGGSAPIARASFAGSVSACGSAGASASVPMAHADNYHIHLPASPHDGLTVTIHKESK
jgi:hypothetical protein